MRPIRSRRLAAALVALCASGGLPPAGANAAAPMAATRAAEWLHAEQRANGSFGSDLQPVDQLAETLAALASANALPATIRDRALQRLREAGPARADEQAAYAARIVLGLVAAGEDPRRFDGIDYVAKIGARYNPVLAAHGGNLYAEALAGLGRLAAGEAVPQAFLDRLVAARCTNGGYAYADRCGRTPDADTTAMIVSVLALAGLDRSDPAIAEALAWLSRLQDASGGFPLEAGFEPNANSTALVLTMLRTLGLSPARWARRGDPAAALAAFATPSGALRFTRAGGPNLWATIQGLPGLVGARFPLQPVLREDPATGAKTTPEPRHNVRGPVAERTPVPGSGSGSPRSDGPRPTRSRVAQATVSPPAVPTAEADPDRRIQHLWLLTFAFGLLYVAASAVRRAWRRR